MEAVVKAGEHLSVLLLQPAIFAAEHAQRQHDEKHQDKATSDWHGDDSGTEPNLVGGGDFL